jgi:hypothetical protein
MARPTIIGTVLRRIDLHCGAGASNKDYRITVTEVAADSCRVYFEHGPARRLQQGGEKTSTPVSEAEAMQIADELMREKQRGKSGKDPYTLVSDQRFTSPAASPRKKPAAKKVPRVSTISTSTLTPAGRALINNLF